MINIRQLRESPDFVRAALARRDPAIVPVLERLLGLDESRRELLAKVERLKATRNKSSEEVARLKKSKADSSALLVELRELSLEIKGLDQQVRSVDEQLEQLQLQVPNLPLPELPDGGPEDYRVLRTWGDPTSLDFDARPHWELGESLGILDLPKGAMIAGSGFPLFLGTGARLVRSLINLMLDVHVREHGYLEIAPPLLVNEDSARGTGQLPDLEENMYVTRDGLYLVPTAEVPVTNFHRNDVLAADVLPRAFVAYTPCFRREAGAHGADTRGIIRVHQFDKVELVRICRPEDSPSELELLLGHAEKILQMLELPYRIIQLAAGDIGFSSAMTYDIEVWAAGVTYVRSREARKEESESAGGGSFYERVYEADRPELFFKCMPYRVRGHRQPIRIRADAHWSVPEPELTLVVSAGGRIVGYTIGNDVCSRDIEGENPLYLPQAKIYDGSCAIGPGILLTDQGLPPETRIEVLVVRNGVVEFHDATSLSQMKRSPRELVDYLYRELSFPRGCMLMTGTGIIPPDDFSLQPGDEVRITVEPIGTLINSVGV